LYHDILNGMRIIANPLLTERVDRVVRLTLKERLLSWPWRPWITTKTVIDIVPSDKILKMPNGTLIVHPLTLSRLRNNINDSRSKSEDMQHL
jgi:hypothetical protein